MIKLDGPQTISRHLKRYRQVTQVLVKHGLGQIVDQLKLWETTNLRWHISQRKHEEHVALTRPERVRLAMEELGPAYIKLGQMLSTRPDLIPPEYVTELEKLQEHAVPFSNEIARQVIQDELNCPLKDAFTKFGKQPVASASLSQVYRAELKTGQVVAVKVQRPGISELVQIDLEIIRDLASRLERHFEKIREFDLVSLVEEFSADMRRELNFTAEAHNIIHFARNFENAPFIHVPTVYKEFSTSKLLVMEYIEGIGVLSLDKLKEQGYNLTQIAHNGADIYLKSILEHGFFHADPHPGNIQILPDNVVCLLDFGMMGRLSDHDREILTGMLKSMVDHDAKGMTRLVLELADSPVSVNTEQLELEISNLIEDYVSISIEELNVGEFLDQLIRLLRNYQLQLPKYYIWLARAVSMVENIACQLDPDFNLAKYSEPYVRDLCIKRFNPFQQIREFRATAADFFKLAKDLPYEIRTITRKAREGRFKVEIEPVGLEPYRLTMNRIFNRIVLAIIIAAVAIGSSVLVLSGLPPLISGIPVIGLAGFIIATLLGIWVIITVLRNGIS